MNTYPQSSLLWRWIALVSLVVSIACSYLSNTRIINEQNNGDVSAKYPTLFTPAGYAFSIWGIIYLALIMYAVFQLLPAQRIRLVYDRLAKPLTAISLLSMVWLIAFNTEWLLASVLLIMAMLVTAIILQIRSREGESESTVWRWVWVPFSLYAGWLTVASIANVAVYLTSLGWHGGQWGGAPWTVIMITVGLTVGILVSWRLRDLIYPLVVAWAFVAIWLARRLEHENVAFVAFSAAAMLMVWTAFFGYKLVRQARYGTAVG